MAEEKQGQGTNPLSEQPSEAVQQRSMFINWLQILGTYYNQLLGTNNPTKRSWPELVGVTAEEAKMKIKKEIWRAVIEVVPPNSFINCDYRTKRVRLYVDESNKVIRTPTTG